MNIDDLIQRVREHKDAPILLAEGVWHAAKQAYMNRFGEGTMFAHPAHPRSFMVEGVPVVCDVAEPQGNADGLHSKEPGLGDAPNADRVLHQDGTSAAIAADATRAGPATDDDHEPDPSAPQAGFEQGQPRPELERQRAEEREGFAAFSQHADGPHG